MKYLLDTEVFLWMQAHPDRIGRDTMNILTDDRNELFLSSASAWGIAQKFRRGRLRLPEPPDEYAPDRLLTSGVNGLSIEHLPLISSDPKLAAFDIEFIDATR